VTRRYLEVGHLRTPTPTCRAVLIHAQARVCLCMCGCMRTRTRERLQALAHVLRHTGRTHIRIMRYCRVVISRACKHSFTTLYPIKVVLIGPTVLHKTEHLKQPTNCRLWDTLVAIT
jgi:hypothetical protein